MSKTLRQMPDNAVPPEWAPNDGEPKYVTAIKLIKKFNTLTRQETIVRLAVIVALLECAPIPIYARWALGIICVAAYLVLRLSIRSVSHRARLLEDINPDQIKVRPEQESGSMGFPTEERA